MVDTAADLAATTRQGRTAAVWRPAGPDSAPGGQARGVAIPQEGIDVVPTKLNND
jgi:hypothetical protein